MKMNFKRKRIVLQQNGESPLDVFLSEENRFRKLRNFSYINQKFKLKSKY